jgi:pyruvate,orthophosphate dikinase
MRELLGGKGANLAEMARLGLPAPPGFTITTEVCTQFSKSGGSYPEGLEKQVREALGKIEQEMGKKFGDTEDPLLVSVRSGARMSMPGMMDTVLNLGLNDATVEGLAKVSGSRRFAFDAYRRFISMYSDVVLQLRPKSKTERDPFEMRLEALKDKRGVENDTDLTESDLEQLVTEYKQLVQEKQGEPFPEDPEQQLWGAIAAVFRSWENPRAIEYRRMYQIPFEWGTAVNVQAMVFGNLGEGCATGVAFTRDPATGESELFGEFLINAQGEDVVAGIRTPQPVSKAQKAEGDKPSLEEVMPEAYEELVEIANKLEAHYKDMQDVEFTIEHGRLFMLQTRSGKRTGLAAIRIATDMVDDGVIDEKTAVTRIEAHAMEHLLAPIFDQKELAEAEKDGRMIAKGLPAGPGAATGKVVFHSEDAKQLGAKGEAVVLVRVETSPEDVGGMEAARGILTSRGGMTSHAALVARQRGKPCVVGAGALTIDYEKAEMRVGEHTVSEGDWISIDGTTGKVYTGQMKPHPSEVIEALVNKTMDVASSDIASRYVRMLDWADKHRRLKVRTNADTPDQSVDAVSLGAEGIGLTRTEHMFFEGDRITAMRRMIVADTEEGRRGALEKLLPMQREDFAGIFRAMNGRPVTIRTLDPPLHEFLPHGDEELEKLADQLEVDAAKLKAVVRSLDEANPMLGHRGCRLGVVYPEITEMQARAILEAALEVQEEGIEVHPEIMIPLVGNRSELAAQRKVVEQVAGELFESRGKKVDYLVGTMIELPRAALTADEIAEAADFFSYGTNDLTQTTFGLSRDDSGKFLQFYFDNSLFEADPFQTLDVRGVGELLRIGTEKGRQTSADLKIGICGEHGGDPSSIFFADQIGLDYVSCSPRRVPVARVAAAQAAIKQRGD